MKNQLSILLFVILCGFSFNCLFAQTAHLPGDIDSSFPLSGMNGNKMLSTLEFTSDGGIIGGIGTATIESSAPFVYKFGGTYFNSLLDGYSYSIKELDNGKLLFGGSFYINFGGTMYFNLVRCNADGTIDGSFSNTYINGDVNAVELDANGKIYIGGTFSNVGGIPSNRIARLNSDGTLDATFNSGAGFNSSFSTVYAIQIQDEGKILVGGEFSQFNSNTHNGLVRLNNDGTIDNTFQTGTGVNGKIKCIRIQKDGKIIVGGHFTHFNGIAKGGVARLNQNGSVDQGFIASGTTDQISTIAIQNNGKILVGGWMNSFNGLTQSGLVRLNKDGSTDMNFNSFPLGLVESILIQADGKVVAGGHFYVYSVGYSNYNIVRLYGDSVYYNSIHGTIYNDTNEDCDHQSDEKKVPLTIVKATPGPYYGISNEIGKYELLVNEGTNTYTISKQLNRIQSTLYDSNCENTTEATITGVKVDTCCIDMPYHAKQCALLNINIQNTRMRRCFRNYTYVNYCNYGNATAADAQVIIEYPDYAVPISSNPMWTSKSGNVLTYNIGSIAADNCGSITLIDSVICWNESIRGLTQCIKATITPASDCVTENPAWDKSSIKVSGSCVNDSASFIIQNGGSGNMSGSHEYRVYVNDTLIYSGTFSLNSGEQFMVKYPAEGQTIRLEADQHTLHPGRSRPRATIEACGVPNPSPAPQGFVTTASQDDLNEEIAYTCNPIIDSYDPNDKLTLPVGIGTAHQVPPGQEFEYTIRFQNTGSDTAFTVVVVDTLDFALDIASFTEGASSHPYTLEISGKDKAVLTYTFFNIRLPDKSTNEPGSNGLVSFRIAIPNIASIGTIVRNKAYIYFDYNSPIITDEVIHTVGITVVEDFSKGSKIQVSDVFTSTRNKHTHFVKIYPNPTTGTVTIENISNKGNLELRIYSTIGIHRKTVTLTNVTTQEVNLEKMEPGTYVYEILQEGERMYGGVLQVR